MTFNEWAAKHPQAALELMDVLGPGMHPPDAVNGKDEAWSQQQVRFKVARAGDLSWRNNVGATPASIETTCPRCHYKYNLEQRPIRYGLANDSKKLNEGIKSSDLIIARRVLITPAHVGQTIAQFGSIETKRPGWRYTGKRQEAAQAAWLALVNRIGGYGKFSTGEYEP